MGIAIARISGLGLSGIASFWRAMLESIEGRRSRWLFPKKLFRELCRESSQHSCCIVTICNSFPINSVAKSSDKNLYLESSLFERVADIISANMFWIYL